MSSGLTFGTIKRIVAILLAIAIVLAAGIIVFQAPAIFGVETDPEASITFEDQRGDGESVDVAEVTLSEGGFVVVTDSDGEPLAVSDYLESGTHENVTVERGEDGAELTGQLTATVHQDSDGDESYDYADSDGEDDRPYLEDGKPVAATATVSTNESDEALLNSFRVDSMSAPESATTNETIEVTAQITNPTELTTQQSVDVRLDGAVLQQRALTLEAEESREVTFEIDTSGTAPGNRTIGVYTDADGELAPIELSFHTDPAVEITGANDSSLSADVAIPGEGFVAVEDASGAIVASSDALEPGEHDDVTVEIDENASIEDDEQLTAVLYEGEPDDAENATPLTYQGERVETTFTLADVPNESGDGGDGGDGNSSDA
ncbi:DUF7282 domain-containing protein [Haloterrigena alkaliphila]|uniref:DUF4179 domain-containing protein n=1 Tax=Haloterrigena alkaliphila TaxID=2816475 RepID=A0A8A2VH29_9EURY|nr:CARDB domain-containing protein [Haloterrigena alkaliphila]QSX00657.1 DUF4179 domain-containing protein [Haloterrigena alkaliphila]